MTKKIIIVSLFVFLCQFQVALAGDETDEKILAKVGDERLTAQIFKFKIRTLPPELRSMLKGDTEKQQELINRWVEVTLLAKEAEATGIAELPEVKIRINEFKKQLLAKELITRRLKQTTSIPGKKLKKYYDSHLDEFVISEQVRASHIMIALPAKPSADEEEQARKTIFEIHERLMQGESFRDQAMTFSNDPNTRKNGGDLGFFGQGTMLKEFEEVAFKTLPDTVSEPFRTKFGWHILKTTAKKARSQQPFQEIKKELESRLVRRKNQAALNSLISDLKAKYDVIEE